MCRAWLGFRGAELAEGALRLGDLVGATLLRGDLERAGGELDGLVAIAARLARLARA